MSCLQFWPYYVPIRHEIAAKLAEALVWSLVTGEIFRIEPSSDLTLQSCKQSIIQPAVLLCFRVFSKKKKIGFMFFPHFEPR
jgi:hypothetical protein